MQSSIIQNQFHPISCIFFFVLCLCFWKCVEIIVIFFCRLQAKMKINSIDCAVKNCFHLQLSKIYCCQLSIDWYRAAYGCRGINWINLWLYIKSMENCLIEKTTKNRKQQFNSIYTYTLCMYCIALFLYLLWI